MFLEYIALQTRKVPGRTGRASFLGGKRPFSRFSSVIGEEVRFSGEITLNPLFDRKETRA
jgi:hypothetical protein